jgi:hypothetical protein
MVDYYSNQPIKDFEINSSNYSEEGFLPENTSDQAAIIRLKKAGVTPDSLDSMKTKIRKEQPASQIAKRNRVLKMLLLQWAQKYLSNPQKYRDHPKQIRDKPSWFDDAIVLFSEGELSAEQKQYLREYMYGLIQYRDRELSKRKLGGGEDEYTAPDIEESERQQGRQSPYNIEENMDVLATKFPHERELSKFDARDVARNMVINKLPRQESSIDEVMSAEPGQEPMQVVSTKPDNRMGVRSVAVKTVSSGLDDYILSPRRSPVQSQGTSQPGMSINQSRSSRMNSSALMGFMGVKPKNTQPVQIPVQNPPSQGTWRRKKPISVKVTRNNQMKIAVQPDIFKDIRSSLSMVKPVTLPKIHKDTSKISNIQKKVELPVLNIQKTPKFDKKMKKISGSITLPKIRGGASDQNFGKLALNMPNIHALMKKENKKANKLIPKQSICDTDTLFKKIRSTSVNHFGNQNMKLPILDNIKDQCGKALKTNNFKQEAIKMKTTYFAEAVASAPKFDMQTPRGKNIIREANMLANISKKHKISSANIKRGSLRPRPMGITKYNFNLGSVFNQPPEPKISEDDYYNNLTPTDNPMLEQDDKQTLDSEYT